MPKSIANKNYDLNVRFRDAQNNIYAAQDNLLYWSRLNAYYLEGAVNPSPECLNPRVGGSVTATYKDDHMATAPVTNYLPEAIAIGERTYPTFNINNNGDLTSGVRYVEYLPTNPAGTFDFTTLANGATTSSNSSDKPFSISLWFRPSFLPSGISSYRQIVGKKGGDGSVSSREAYMIRAQGGLVAFHLLDSSGVATNKRIYARTSTVGPPALAVGSWTHIVCTYNADPNITGNDKQDLLTIYINGERAINQTTHTGAGTYNGMLPKHDEPLSVGHGTVHQGWHASGDVAELALWDRALSAGEVAAVYNATKLSMMEPGSGYLSNPARVRLLEEDQIANTYPRTKTLGGMPREPQFRHMSNDAILEPYVDSSTIDFMSPYATAEIEFTGMPLDARTITLHGSWPGPPLTEFLTGKTGHGAGAKATTSLPDGTGGGDTNGSSAFRAAFPDWRTFPDVAPAGASPTPVLRSQLAPIAGESILIGQLLVFAGPQVATSVDPATGATVGGSRSLFSNQLISPSEGTNGDTLLSFLVARGGWDYLTYPAYDAWGRLRMEPPDSSGVLAAGFEGLVVQYSTNGTTWYTVHGIAVGNEPVQTLELIPVAESQGGGTLADNRNTTSIPGGATSGLHRIKVNISYPGSPYYVRIAQLYATSTTGDNWGLKDLRMYRTAGSRKFEFQRGIISEADSTVVDLTNLSKEQRTRWQQQEQYRAKIDKSTTPKSNRQILRKVLGMQAAAKFAETVNQHTPTLRIRAIVENNVVRLNQMCPGRGGNTPIEVGARDFKNVVVAESFEGGQPQSAIYPVVLPYDTKYLTRIAQGTRLHTTSSILLSGPPLGLTNIATPSVLGPKPIVAQAPIRRGVSDGNPTLDISSDERVRLFTAYDDSLVALPELEFYEEGISGEIKEFFSSPLRDKAMIVIDLEPADRTHFGYLVDEPGTTGGRRNGGPNNLMVYYNFDRRMWETIGPGQTQRVYSEGQVKSFLDTACIGFSRGVELIASGTNSQCRPISEFGFPFHPKFHATGSQALDMSRYITAPFVLEKYVYAYSGSWSPGSSYDFLTNLSFYDSYRSGSVPSLADSNGWNQITSQSNAQIDNGENSGWTDCMGRSGLSGGDPMWMPTYVDQCHRAAINSFFMLRQSKASFPYSYNSLSANVDDNGALGIFEITGSVPRKTQLTSGSNATTAVVDTTRDLVTYGQWTTYAPAPSGSQSPSGIPYAIMINDMSGVLDEGLAREVNTLDYGYFTPFEAATQNFGDFNATSFQPTADFEPPTLYGPLTGYPGDLIKTAGGSGYTADPAALLGTTAQGSSTGVGAKVYVTAIGAGGAVTTILVDGAVRGYGYKPGDRIRIDSGDGLAEFEVQNGGTLNISRGGTHKVQPSPTGSYIMRGVSKRPVTMSGSFSFQTGHDGNDEFNFRTSWRGGRSGRGIRSTDPRALVKGVDGMQPRGVAPDLDYTSEQNYLRMSVRPRNVNTFEFDDTSPYIIMPEDQLVFGWQTTMPGKLGRVTDCGPSTKDPYGYNFHGRRGSGPNMTLEPGAGKLILFGSFIKQDKELLPSSEQSLVSNQIHQVIGDNPVVDQFDVEYIESFAGSMFEEHVTGSMLDEESIGGASTPAPWPTPKARGISATANGTPNAAAIGTPWQNLNRSMTLQDSGTFRRFVRHPDSGERYYDSLVGDPSIYHAITNPGLAESLNGGAGSGGADDAIPVAPYGLADNSFSITFGSDAINARWMGAFPFEGVYADVDRLSLLDGFDDEINIVNSSNSVIGKAIPKSVFLALPGGGNDIIISSPAGETELPAARDAILKFWFGSGNGMSGSVDLVPTNIGTRRSTPKIRGWKYGLKSALPVNASAVYRRETYGQFRDMLEQRKNTRFFNEGGESENDRSFVTVPAVSVLFIDSETGDTTSPINTRSQNLSSHATSSVPYFDGDVRDREDNPDVNADFTITI